MGSRGFWEALEGGRLTAIRTGRLYPQEYPGTHFKRLSQPRAHGIVGCHGKKSLVITLGIDPGTFQPVPQCFNHYAKYNSDQTGDGFTKKTKLLAIFDDCLLTLSLPMSYIYGAPCKARNFNVVFLHGPTFGNAESRLFLFAAQCFNIESMQKVFLCHSYV
jgi:hypothetical protein